MRAIAIPYDLVIQILDITMNTHCNGHMGFLSDGASPEFVDDII